MVAHVPQVRQQIARGDTGPAPREPGPNDLRPLRVEGEWRPTIILRRFGGIRKETEFLPRLLVACAAVSGVHRIREMTERLVGLANVALPRVQRMIDDETLERRHGTLKDIVDRLHAARQDLPATRARANNDLDNDHPDGLREIDLEMLVAHTESVMVGTEVATKRNLTGIDFAIHLATTPPDQRYAEDWLDRALGTAGLSGILLFTPREYGRVVIVYEDGRLAYDPAAAAPEDQID
jgi:hypothetical protein